jgi:hypothetical protein
MCEPSLAWWRCDVDADHAGDLLTRRSRTGFIVFLNGAPIYWSSKKQTSCKASTFGSEFVAMKQATEYIRNQSVLANTTAPCSTLKKKSNAIAYHFVWEGCARDEWRTTYINTDKNVADLLTKPLAGPKLTNFVRMLLHHYVWWGRGEDYDEFEGIRTSTCLFFESKLTMIFVFVFMISQWGIWVWWFPNVT